MTLQGTNPWMVQLTSGSVITSGGNSSVQVNNIVTGQSSVYLIPGVGVIGSVAALQGTNPWVSNGSVAVMSAVPHSVATLQGTNPWVIGNSSVMLTAGTNTIGSVAVLQGTPTWVTGLVSTNASVLTVLQAASIVGTYAEDTAHADGQKGIFIMGVRNDTVASFVSADLDYSPHGTDSAGRTLIKPFAANQASVYSHASVVNGGDSGSVLVLAAAGTGLRNYVTDWAVANTGSVATLITFTEGGGSVLGRTIAPAGGGSNFPGAMMPMANVTTNHVINMVTATASSVVYVTMRGYIAP